MSIHQPASTISHIMKSLGMTGLALLMSAGLATAAEPLAEPSDIVHLLTNQHMTLGIVDAIQGKEIRITTGATQSGVLFLREHPQQPHPHARVGDLVVLLVNTQHQIIRYHWYGEPVWHLTADTVPFTAFSENPAWALSPGSPARPGSLDLVFDRSDRYHQSGTNRDVSWPNAADSTVTTLDAGDGLFHVTMQR